MTQKIDKSASPLDAIRAARARTELDWEPQEVGEQVVGFVAAIEYMATKNGETPRIALDTEDGTRVLIWCGRTRLRRQLARNKVQPGDGLGIRYEGSKTAASGNTYFDYRVDVYRVGERVPGEMFRDADDDDLLPGAKQASSEAEAIWSDDAEPDF
jgi:hypothetical protein